MLPMRFNWFLLNPVPSDENNNKLGSAVLCIGRKRHGKKVMRERGGGIDGIESVRASDVGEGLENLGYSEVEGDQRARIATPDHLFQQL